MEEVPNPIPGPGEVSVRVRSALTCGTDLKVFQRGYHARMLRPPVLFGHEFSGVVEAAGPGAERWKPGTRVVAANSAPCGACFYCRKNQPNLCDDLLFVNGAYAESILLPARLVEKNLLEIPRGLPFGTAALTEPLACVLHGMEAVRPAAGETAILLGAGPIGLLFAQLLLAAKADLILAGKGAARLEAARALGVGKVFDLAETPAPVETLRAATPSGKGADLVIEAVGLPAAWEQAVALSRPGGRVLFFGGCPAGTRITLDTGHLHYGQRSLFSTFHHTPEAIRRSLAALAAGEVRAEPLISRQAPLADLPGILKKMLTEKDAVKTEIAP